MNEQTMGLAETIIPIALGVGALFLLVLGVLLPFFVWRISVHARALRDSAQKSREDMNWRLDMILNELRGKAPAEPSSSATLTED